MVRGPRQPDSTRATKSVLKRTEGSRDNKHDDTRGNTREVKNRIGTFSVGGFKFDISSGCRDRSLVRQQYGHSRALEDLKNVLENPCNRRAISELPDAL